MTEPSRSDPWLRHAIFLLSSAFMASNVLIGRAAADQVPPVGMAFWRWFGAFLLILPFAWPGLLRHRRVLLAQWRRLLVLGALGMGVCGAVVYVGLADTTATNAGLIYATSPVMILLLAAVTAGEPVRPRQGVGIAMALAGVLAILARGDPTVLPTLAFAAGDLWVLAGAVSWAVFTILLRSRHTPLPVVTLFAANAGAGVLVLAPFYAWETLSGRPVVPTADAVASLGGLALFASVLAFLTYQKSIALIGPSRAATALYVMPLWAALIARAWLGEALHPYHLAGAALVLPGVFLATAAAPPARRPAAT